MRAMLNDDSPLVPDQPTREGWGVRFACGLIAGFVAGFFVAYRFLGLPIRPSLIWTVGIGIAFGIFSAVQGDRFWYRFMAAFRWIVRPHP